MHYVVVKSNGVLVSFRSGNEDAWDGIGLLVILRLWRVARIANGERTPSGGHCKTAVTVFSS